MNFGTYFCIMKFCIQSLQYWLDHACFLRTIYSHQLLLSVFNMDLLLSLKYILSHFLVVMYMGKNCKRQLKSIYVSHQNIWINQELHSPW